MAFPVQLFVKDQGLCFSEESLQRQFAGQFEQSILQHLFGGQVGILGNAVIKSGCGGVEADEKFFHSILLYMKVYHSMHKAVGGKPAMALCLVCQIENGSVCVGGTG